MACKWRVFREKLPAAMNPMWVVWDESGEYLFPTGGAALRFVDGELRNRHWARIIRQRQEDL
jgi:hypothetical protein